MSILVNNQKYSYKNSEETNIQKQTQFLEPNTQSESSEKSLINLPTNLNCNLKDIAIRDFYKRKELTESREQNIDKIQTSLGSEMKFANLNKTEVVDIGRIYLNIDNSIIYSSKCHNSNKNKSIHRSYTLSQNWEKRPTQNTSSDRTIYEEMNRAEEDQFDVE
jgi:hypothetical protein